MIADKETPLHVPAYLQEAIEWVTEAPVGD